MSWTGFHKVFGTATNNGKVLSITGLSRLCTSIHRSKSINLEKAAEYRKMTKRNRSMAEMRWYGVISIDNTVERPYISTAEDLYGLEPWHLRNGELIPDWNPAAWIKCTDPEYDGTPDDALQNDIAIPIYSARLQAAVCDAGIQGIQFLPIHVLRLDGSEIPGFAVANVDCVRPAMDMERSHFDVFEDDYFIPERRGEVAIVFNMVLKRSELKYADIIRIEQFLPGVYVSERFKRAFESAGCTGNSFVEVEVSD